jgi:hypothetical protein
VLLWGCARAETGEATARAFIAAAILSWWVAQLGRAGWGWCPEEEGAEGGNAEEAAALSGAEEGESERG